MHDGYKNKYSFMKEGKSITLAPLTPAQAYEDQIKLKNEKEKRVRELEKKRENSEVVGKKQKRVGPHERKEIESSEMREKPKVNFFAKGSELKKATVERQLMILLVYKESLLNFEESNTSLPSFATSLLQEFDDVFSEDVPSGLPPIRGIEHQIDFIFGAVIPNRQAYRNNSEEAKEL